MQILDETLSLPLTLSKRGRPLPNHETEFKDFAPRPLRASEITPLQPMEVWQNKEVTPG
jgi:hypothetical protein